MTMWPLYNSCKVSQLIAHKSQVESPFLPHVTSLFINVTWYDAGIPADTIGTGVGSRSSSRKWEVISQMEPKGGWVFCLPSSEPGTSLITKTHFQNLQHLLLLHQRSHIPRTAKVLQATLRNPLQLIPSDPIIAKRPWQPQLTNDRVQRIAQVCLALDEAALNEHTGDVRLAPKSVEDDGLLRGVDFCIVFLYGGEADASCFRVRHADGA